jgi:hypothetical protein
MIAALLCLGVGAGELSPYDPLTDRAPRLASASSAPYYLVVWVSNGADFVTLRPLVLFLLWYIANSFYTFSTILYLAAQ